jgi:uncharacterized protein (DUF697 family)
MSEDNSSPPKKPTLSQQVKAQAREIGELSSLIQQKEKELANLGGQDWLINELTHKLQETETDWRSACEQVQNQRQLIGELTSKLQEVEIKLAAAFIQSQRAIADNVVKTHIVAGMALGFLPFPLLDMVASSGVQANLLRNLCKHYEVDFDEQASKCALSSMVRGSLPVLAVLSLSSITKLIPGIGTLGGGISMTILVGATVYATGQVFIRHFEAGGSLQNFNNKHWQAFFQQQFEEGKAFVKANRIRD